MTNRTVKFSILRAAPDELRGESMNVGVVVFDGADTSVRLTAPVWRLRALHPDFDQIDPLAWSQEMEGALAEAKTVEDKVLYLQFLGGAIKCDAKLGQVDVPNGETSGATIAMLLKRFVDWPERTVARLTPDVSQTRSKLHTQLRMWFRRSKVFSSKTADIAHGKVVSGYPVDIEDDLFADFALKNGAVHIIETLDLRGIDRITRASQGQVGLKSVLLDQAKRRLSPESRCIAVTAADDYVKLRASIRLFSGYADDVYAMESAEDRQRLAQFVAQSLHVNAALPLLVGV